MTALIENYNPQIKIHDMLDVIISFHLYLTHTHKKKKFLYTVFYTKEGRLTYYTIVIIIITCLPVQLLSLHSFVLVDTVVIYALRFMMFQMSSSPSLTYSTLNLLQGKFKNIQEYYSYWLSIYFHRNFSKKLNKYKDNSYFD